MFRNTGVIPRQKCTNFAGTGVALGRESLIAYR